MKARIRALAFELGFDVCRFTHAQPPQSGEHFERWIQARNHGEMGYLERNAPKRADLQKVLPDAKSVICLATNYFHSNNPSPPPPGPPKTASPHARTALYAQSTDYHDTIGERLKSLTSQLAEWAGSAHRSLWYVDTGPILERDLAERSGVGFIGKHTNLISRKFGNWIFLSEILTTVELEPDASEHNHCGSCTRCIQACPTQAITAPFQLDARRCISYLTIEFKGSIPEEWRSAIGDRVYGCDDCLAVCPWNRFAKEASEWRGFLREDLQCPDLHAWLALDDEGFRSRFRGTPLFRAKRARLLRNVCVVLGNIGDASSLPPLSIAACDPDPLISEHASWAIHQIESRA